MYEQLKKNWLLYLLIMQPILDIIAYFQQDNVIGSLAGYSRLVIMCILPIVTLYITKKKKSFLVCIGVIFAYCVLHVLNCFRVGYISPFADIAYMARVVQMPVLAFCFIYLIKDDTYGELTKKAFFINVILIFVSMCIAHLSGTGDYSYNLYKAGLKGWFVNSNSQSIIIVTLIPLALDYLNQKKNLIWSVLFAAIAWFMMISNGTRVAYFSIFIIFGGYVCYYIFHYLIHRKDGAKFKTVLSIVYICLMVISIIGYPKTPRYYMTHLYNDAREKDEAQRIEELEGIEGDPGITLEEILSDPANRERIIRYYTPLLDPGMVNRFGTEKILYAYGYLPDSWLITDVRKTKRINAELIWDESDMITKLIGFEYTNVENPQGDVLDLENDYPAIFYYYGYLGFGLYLLFLFYFIYLIGKTVILNFEDAINPFNFALLLTYILQIASAQFSGAILRRPNVSIYMSIIMGLIYYQTMKKTAKTADKKNLFLNNNSNTSMIEG